MSPPPCYYTIKQVFANRVQYGPALVERTLVGLEMAKERLGLPMEVGKPVLFRPGVLVAVGFDILPVHELVEGKLHRVFTVGKAIVAVETVDEPGTEFPIEFGPSRIAEDHFFIISLLSSFFPLPFLRGNSTETILFC